MWDVRRMTCVMCDMWRVTRATDVSHVVLSPWRDGQCEVWHVRCDVMCDVWQRVLGVCAVPPQAGMMVGRVTCEMWHGTHHIDGVRCCCCPRVFLSLCVCVCVCDTRRVTCDMWQAWVMTCRDMRHRGNDGLWKGKALFRRGMQKWYQAVANSEIFILISISQLNCRG